MNNYDPVQQDTDISQASRLKELRGRVYAELHKLANAHMRNERLPHTLQATALLNKAALRQ